MSDDIDTKLLQIDNTPDWAKEGYDPTATENSSRYIEPLYSELQNFLSLIGHNPHVDDEGNPITDASVERGVPPSETAVAPELATAPPPSETALSFTPEEKTTGPSVEPSQDTTSDLKTKISFSPNQTSRVEPASSPAPAAARSPLLQTPPPSETAVVPRPSQSLPRPSTTPADKPAPSTTPAPTQRQETSTQRIAASTQQPAAPASPQGGMLEKIFSGVDFQSNHRPVVENGVINWGNPDNPADFARASKVITEMMYGGGGQKASAPSGSPRSAAVASYGDGSTLPILRAIRATESSDNPNAKNPRSSAGGLYQFTDGTWGSVLRRMAPDVYANYNDKQLSTLKPHEKLQEMAAKFHLENDILPKLAKHNIPATPGNIYLSWFQGPDGAVRAYNAPDNAYVAQVFPGTVTANAPMRFNGKPYAEWTMRDLRGFTDAAMARRMRAEGGRLIQDEFPTHYLPHVGRQVMNDGGVPADDPTVKSALQMLYELEGEEFKPVEEVKSVETIPLKPLDENSMRYGEAEGVQPTTMPYGEQMKNVWETVKPTPQGTKDASVIAGAGVAGTPMDILGLAHGARQLAAGRVPSAEEMQLPFGSHDLEHRAKEAGILSEKPSIGAELTGGITSLATDPISAASKLKWLAVAPMIGKAEEVAKAAQKAEEAAKAVQLAKRELTPLGFYSHGEEMARALPQEKGTPEQFAGMLVRQGVKPEEMFASGFADEAATAAMRSRIESEFQPKVEAAQKALEGLVPGTPEYKAAERQFKNISSTMRSEIDRALVLSQEMASRPNLTREEAAQYFRERMPQIEEKVYQSGHNYPYRSPDEWQDAINAAERRRDFDEAERLTLAWEETEGVGSRTKYQSYTMPGGENYREIVLKAPVTKGPKAKEVMDLTRRMSAGEFNHLNDAERADFYARLERLNQEMKSEKSNQPPFQSGHWPEDKNVIAHIRLADRTVPADPDRIEDIARRLSAATNAPINSWGSGMAEAAVTRGIITPEEAATYARLRGWTGSNFYNQKGLEQKILHVEELQSDWAQQGRKQGFVKPIKYDDLVEGRPSGYPEDVEPLMQKNWYIREKDALLPQAFDKELFPTIEDAKKAYLDQNKMGRVGTPIGPYVTNTQAWTDLALKRVLNEAAKGGYDKVVWTPGAEQAKRYDLSKQINRVTYDPNEQILAAYDHNGRQVMHEYGVEPHKIEDYIGKEPAEKLRREADSMTSTFDEYGISKDPEAGGWTIDLYGEPLHDYGGELLVFRSKSEARDHLREMVDADIASHTPEISGLDLQVGGEGMKGYYDKIVPTQLQKLVKKIDPEAKIGRETLSGTRSKDELAAETFGEGETYRNLPSEFKRQIDEMFMEEGIQVPSLTITPKMRENILKGLTAYADGGAVDDNQAVSRALEMTRHLSSHNH